MRRTHYTVLQTTVEQIDYCMIQSNDRWAMIIIVRICLCVCGHALTHLHLQWGGVLPYGVDCLMRFCRFDSTVCRIVNEWLICRGTWTHTYVKRRSPTQALHFSRDMPISIFRMFIWLYGARGCTVPCFFSPFLYIGQCTYSRSPAQWFLHFFFLFDFGSHPIKLYDAASLAVLFLSFSLLFHLRPLSEPITKADWPTDRNGDKIEYPIARLHRIFVDLILIIPSPHQISV